MARPIVESIDDRSDIVAPEFASNFSNRLLVHHATIDSKFNKKSFEYAFKEASRSAGRTANLNDDPTLPGADVDVDGVGFSLKTEAAASIHGEKITISKLMEASWIRECVGAADFARETTRRVVKHLESYERVLILRAFDVAGPSVRYDLIEIPVVLLRRIATLTAEDFSPRTKRGGSRAEVRQSGKRVFTVRLDGSVEKVTVSGLLVSECLFHASWTVPASWATGPGEADDDESGPPADLGS